MFPANGNATHVYKVIIVGAGVAGLAAAKTLKEAGVDDFLVIEAQDKIGGRVSTVEFGLRDDSSPGLVELGAQWIHGEENSFFKYLTQRGLVDGKTSWEGDGEFRTPSGKILNREKVEKIIKWVEAQLDDIECEDDNVQFSFNRDELSSSPTPIQDYCRRSLTSSPALSRKSMGPSPVPVKYTSVGEYLRIKFEEHISLDSNSNTESGTRICETDLTVEEKLAVFQWAMSFQRIDNSCNQMTDLSYKRWADFEVNGGELYNNFKGGAQEMVNCLRQDYLQESQLLVNSPVTKIDWTTEEVQVFVTSPASSGRSRVFLCHSVIVTCSIGVLHSSLNTLFNPSLPHDMTFAIQGTGFGPVTKLYVEWEEQWWPSDLRGYQLVWPGEALNCCDQDYELENRNLLKRSDWVKAITGFDPVLENPKVLLAWVGGPEALLLETLSEDQVMEDCTKVLSQFTRLCVPRPKKVIVSKWNSNPFVKGAYCYRSVEGDKVPGDIVGTLKLPIYNCDDTGLLKPAIIFAGEALHKTHYSTVHGAFESGEEQTKLLLELQAIWQRQRDQE